MKKTPISYKVISGMFLTGILLVVGALVTGLLGLTFSTFGLLIVGFIFVIVSMFIALVIIIKQPVAGKSDISPGLEMFTEILLSLLVLGH